MKKLTKKNNKGFSLVELIVVVLIMAIIAVALAPQVTKWVENSRQATDLQTKDSIVSALQVASTDKTILGTEITVTVKSSGATWTGASDAQKTTINAIYDVSSAKAKSNKSTIEVTLTATGKVTGTLTVTDGLSGDLQ